METFDEIYILDLHGNANKGERCPDGSPDKNVFEIMQGVSINIFVKTGTENTCTVHHAELFGEQKLKYDALTDSQMAEIPWRTLQPHTPDFFFVPKDFSLEAEYTAGFSVAELFPFHNLGIKTDRDSLFFDFDEESLRGRCRILLSGSYSSEFATRFDVKNSSSFKLTDRIQGKIFNAKKLRLAVYRVFDTRWLYYDPTIVSRPSFAVMRHMLHNNLALCLLRNSRGKDALLPFVTNTIVGKDCVSSLDNCQVFPLYLFDETLSGVEKRKNLDNDIVRELETRVGRKVKPEEVFGWVYGVLHSGAYREKYKEFLKVDFPRVPWPTGAEEFEKVSQLGWQLAQIHVMADFPEARDVKWKGDGGREVAKAKWADGAVWVNAASHFEGVDEATWQQWIGGYQPLQKWLKDRKGRTLSPADISHYKRMVQALRRTRELMAEIDALPLSWAGQG